MARDLKARLKRLKEFQDAGGGAGQRGDTGDAPGQAAGAGAHGSLQGVVLAGWGSLAPFVRTKRTRVAVSGASGPGMESGLLGRHVDFETLRFMDTETTGLSGGAGTTVFLVGSANYFDGVVTVDQTLLVDFPGEPEFLRAVHDQLWGGSTWVSYNGKAFDSRLLQTRFIINGEQVELPEQLDLLYWARRLWRRRIGRCSLGDIEREILGVVRTDDVPGIQIPDLYFDFLKSGDATGLLPVFAHHLEDIVSLVRLFFHIEDIFVSLSDSSAILSSFDRTGLGRYLVSHTDAPGERLLQEVIFAPHADETLEEREKAAFALARHFRRQDRSGEAAVAWDHLRTEGSVIAGIECAKHLEHRERDLEAATRLVESLLSGVHSDQLTLALEHRLARLRRKLQK